MRGVVLPMQAAGAFEALGEQATAAVPLLEQIATNSVRGLPAYRAEIALHYLSPAYLEQKNREQEQGGLDAIK